MPKSMTPTQEPKRKGRPPYYGPFNPDIPTFLRHTHLEPRAMACVEFVITNKPNTWCHWLNLSTAIANYIFKLAKLEHGAGNQISNERYNALVWAKRKGKYDWRKPPEKNPPSLPPLKRKAS